MTTAGPGTEKDDEPGFEPYDFLPAAWEPTLSPPPPLLPGQPSSVPSSDEPSGPGRAEAPETVEPPAPSA
ncbi:hypothetical protein GCM10010272_37930 [Streptomyces lateritius]|nr:hypothetical protein GCM10010272_37930 [Streptomyces lateritius]